MKAQRVLFLCASVFALLLVTLLVRFNHAKPRLLVLHSHTEDGRWEQMFDSGVRRALEGNRTPLATRWHYMRFSSATFPTDAEWQAASTRAQAVIEAWRPDVILLVDEESQQWVGQRYVSTKPGAPRLIYATAEDPQRFGYLQAANVSGVRERLPLPQVLEVLQRLEQRPLRIQALGMADPTGEAEREQVLSFDWKGQAPVPVTLVSDFAQWQQAVQAASGQADALLLLSFTGLPRSGTQPELVDSLEVARWTERNAKPLTLSVRARYAAGGGALSIATAADALGEQAARLALQALPGLPLPPPQVTDDFVIGLRPALLANRGYQLPRIYEQAARAAHLLFEDASQDEAHRP